MNHRPIFLSRAARLERRARAAAGFLLTYGVAAVAVGAVTVLVLYA
jgi:hypothetical protein